MRLDGNFCYGIAICCFVVERVVSELLLLLHREQQKTIQNQVGHSTFVARSNSLRV